MKLKDVLALVMEISSMIRKARMDVKFCEECGEDERSSQKDHHTKHFEEALRLLDRLPESMRGYSTSIHNIRVNPEIKLKLDERGHVIIDVWDVDVR